MKSWIILIVLAVALTAAATVAMPFLDDRLLEHGPGLPRPRRSRDGPGPGRRGRGGPDLQVRRHGPGTTGKHAWIFKNTGPGALELAEPRDRLLLHDRPARQARAPADKRPLDLDQAGRAEPIDV